MSSETYSWKYAQTCDDQLLANSFEHTNRKANSRTNVCSMNEYMNYTRRQEVYSMNAYMNCTRRLKGNSSKTHEEYYKLLRYIYYYSDTIKSYY